MKKAILLICLLCSCIAYAQVSNKVLYAVEGSCVTSTSKSAPDEEAQHLSFRLQNGSLFITGKITANCCGNHYLMYEIYPDSISLSCIDEDGICKCLCPYNVNTEIKNCPANSYKVSLAGYDGYGGNIETTVHRAVSTIDPIQIGHGCLYGNGAENVPKQNTVITTRTEWETLLTAMCSVNDITYELSETEIDFTKYRVIAAVDAVRPSSGWSIDITDITEYADNIVVTCTNLEANGAALTVMTQPYHIVKIPTSDKAVVFQDKTTGAIIVGLQGAENQTVEIHPNPFDKMICVEYPDEELTALSIHNLSGKRVFQEEVAGFNVCVEPNLPSGTYALIIETASGKKHSKKIVRL